MTSADRHPGPYASTDGIRPADHAKRRYQERTPDDSVPFAFAWRNGVEVPKWVHGAFETKDGDLPTRVRAYRGHSELEERDYHSVFIVAPDRVRDQEHEAIVTIYTVSDIYSIPTRAFISAQTALEQEVVV